MHSETMSDFVVEILGRYVICGNIVILLSNTSVLLLLFAVAPRRGSVDLNFTVPLKNTDGTSRSPQGERGFKSFVDIGVFGRGPSLPAGGAWI